MLKTWYNYKKLGGIMSDKNFSKEEIKILEKNINVKKVTETYITYTENFIKDFVCESKKGKSSRQIFNNAGFDMKLIGPKRIKAAAYRWRKKVKENIPLGDLRKINSGRKLKRELSANETIARLTARNKLLEMENELLKKVDLIERGLITKIY